MSTRPPKAHRTIDARHARAAVLAGTERAHERALDAVVARALAMDRLPGAVRRNPR
ncbi:MAG TPA: hypothetical protein VFO79_14455 [Xanthomonadales bacterium]|nr:hypothetical protein [Xanthomonadales bacterium]